ncbi:uncharacterized protein LOC62_01G000510 [Vanrija pseudolonga]|uniref:Clr5 domain-containing protein n=1 Tax=Vanrija pseudolonga TaxID=143232 RepID=A0AAF0XZM6_9TREE|nr:hypothetical protein LOC62_01G000510 [Vanrija pseudolonga]
MNLAHWANQAGWSDREAVKGLTHRDICQRHTFGNTCTLASIVWKYHKQLSDIVQRHEATIQKRWAKKTKAQRLRILLSAWPNMLPIHRPELEAYKRRSPNPLDADERDVYMFPYINQEDLVKPRTFPLLLNARARNLPCDFAGADLNAMHLGSVLGVISCKYLNEHTMMLNGMRNPDDYGKLLSWDDHPEAMKWMVTKQFQPGDGLLVLEVQGRILEFLAKCAQQLLSDIPIDRLLSEEYPVLPEPSLAPEAATSLVNSLADLAEEAPYRLPRAIDLARIEFLLQARYDQAVDHLWTLREDPGYLAEQYHEHEQHRHENIRDTLGGKHPIFAASRVDNFTSRVVREMILQASLHVVTFPELLAECRSLRRLHARYGAQLSPLDELPEPYLQAILEFRHHLQQASKQLFRQLRNSAPSSPPLRKYWARRPTTNIDRIEAFPLEVSGEPQALAELLWFLQTLWEDGQVLSRLTFEFVIESLIKHIETQAEQYVTNHLGTIIADLSILAECLRQLNSYYPWSQGYNFALLDRDRKDRIRRATDARTEGLVKVHLALDHRNDLSFLAIANLANPAHNRFLYPVERRRSKENVDKLRQAEANLDEFWGHLDAHLRRHGYPLQPPAGRTLQRTPEWVAPAKKPAASVKSVEATFLDLRIGASPPSTTPDTAPKTKIKTRGTAVAAPTGAAPVPEAVATPTAPTIQFAVDARALKVFRILFFTPNVSDTPGEAPWNDFVHAMNSVGFQAEKVYGSVWQFWPTDTGNGAMRSIQFHEPHPVSKIPFREARRMGRRLTRAFDWTVETFALAKK